MSAPSILRSAGSLPPARRANVGRMSNMPVIASVLRAGGNLPGHQAMVGTRMPPSHVLPL